MATILPVYDWTRASAHVDKIRSRAYPWDEWLDGQIRKLDRVTDFDGPAMSVERVIRTSANRRGIRVRIRVEGDSIYLQAHTEDARNKARGVTKSATKKAVKEAQAAKKDGNGNGVAPSVVISPRPEKAPRKVAAEPATSADFAKAKAATKSQPGALAALQELQVKEATNAKTKANGKAVAPAAAPKRKLVRT
jgi:hypothetical protein